MLDACACPPNYDSASFCKQCDPCHSGPDTGCVQVTNMCNLHGQCVVQNGLPTCACDDGWGGMGCTAQTKLTPTQQTDVGLSVGLPLALLGLGAAGLFYMRRSGTSFMDLVPSSLQQVVGGRGGSGPSFTSSSSGGDVSTSNALFSTPEKKAAKEGSKLLVARSYGAL